MDILKSEDVNEKDVAEVSQKIYLLLSALPMPVDSIEKAKHVLKILVYTKNCIAIIERAYNNPEWYIDMLRNIDFILFEFMLKNQKFDYTLFSEHCKNYLVNEKLKACKNVLFFICSSAAVHLGDIWKEENDFVPQKIHNIEN